MDEIDVGWVRVHVGSLGGGGDPALTDDMMVACTALTDAAKSAGVRPSTADTLGLIGGGQEAQWLAWAAEAGGGGVIVYGLRSLLKVVTDFITQWRREDTIRRVALAHEASERRKLAEVLLRSKIPAQILREIDGRAAWDSLIGALVRIADQRDLTISDSGDRSDPSDHQPPGLT